MERQWNLGIDFFVSFCFCSKLDVDSTDKFVAVVFRTKLVASKIRTVVTKFLRGFQQAFSGFFPSLITFEFGEFGNTYCGHVNKKVYNFSQ